MLLSGLRIMSGSGPCRLAGFLVLLRIAAAQSGDERAKIEPVRESITVTASIAAEAPASIVEIRRPQLESIPGVNLDDRMRAVPGFSLFRRSSSLAANPTTQGVSLRGLGSSGASRTLVLWDGIPVNSPFGGWIYWSRLAPEDIDRIEVSRGASTSVFGDKAMGGAINLFSREAEPWRLTAGSEGGNAGQVGLYGGFSQVWKRVAASARLRAFTMDGYYILPQANRGPVDQRAGVDFVAGLVRLDFLGARNRLFVRLDTLAERRRNGTALTPNSTGLGTLAASWTRARGRNQLMASLYHTRENYHAWFSAIAAGRRTETLSFMQHAPSEAVGAAGLWSHGGTRWTAIAGGDFVRAAGSSTDSLVPSGVRLGDGVRFSRGVFGQWNGAVGPARLYAGARQDFTGNGHSFFSPNGGVVIGKGVARVRASAYRSFRAPTLNELYRTFRAGNTVTQANPALLPERLFGAEAGIDLAGERRRLAVTVFRNSLDDLIANVTLSTTPALTTRERRNAAAAVTHGVEATLRQAWGRGWLGELAYLFADSRYQSGLRIPQVAKQQGSATLTWSRGGTLVSSGLRASSLQFEDDVNTLALAGYSTVQLAARQRIAGGLSAKFEMENALGHQYLTGRTPAPQIGAPRLYRVGMVWDGAVK
jgi:outer membrane cobalamin receptor